MTTKALTKREINAEAVYTAWTSGAAALPDGSEVVFKRGQQFRGTAAIVRERPNLFVEATVPQSEWPSEWTSIIERDMATDTAMRAEQARNAAPEIPADRRVHCAQSFRAGARTFHQGNVYDLNDKVVEEHKRFFETRRPLT